MADINLTGEVYIDKTSENCGGTVIRLQTRKRPLFAKIANVKYCFVQLHLLGLMPER